MVQDRAHAHPRGDIGKIAWLLKTSLWKRQIFLMLQRHIASNLAWNGTMAQAKGKWYIGKFLLKE